MKKKCLLSILTVAALLVLSGCDSSSRRQTEKPSAPSAGSTSAKKPAGVPSATCNKVKTLESQHNGQVEKALEP